MQRVIVLFSQIKIRGKLGKQEIRNQLKALKDNIKEGALKKN